MNPIPFSSLFIIIDSNDDTSLLNKLKYWEPREDTETFNDDGIKYIIQPLTKTKNQVEYLSDYTINSYGFLSMEGLYELADLFKNYDLNGKLSMRMCSIDVGISIEVEITPDRVIMVFIYDRYINETIKYEIDSGKITYDKK
jgi:hypothetical protein